MGVYIGRVMCASTIERKIIAKHNVQLADVIEALQYPAQARAAWEDHPEHGRRLVAEGHIQDGRRLIAVLLPAPWWDPNPDTWILKTSRWMDN